MYSWFRARVRVLVVCRANICRSPMVEGLIRSRLQEAGIGKSVLVDSAGTKASQPGHKPDPRACRVMDAAGVSLAGIKARRVKVKDLVRSDFILAMDKANFSALNSMCPPEHQHKIKLLMGFSPALQSTEVPDPYYGNIAGFEEVLRLADIAVGKLVEQLQDEVRTL